MDSLIKKVQVIGIDNERIEKDDSFPAAYKLPFKLSERPDSRWAEIFEYIHQNRILDAMKRRAYVAGDWIFVIISESDNTQHQSDIIKRAVEDTNKEVDGLNQGILAEMKRKKEDEEEEIQAIEKLKEKADKIKF